MREALQPACMTGCKRPFGLTTSMTKQMVERGRKTRRVNAVVMLGAASIFQCPATLSCMSDIAVPRMRLVVSMATSNLSTRELGGSGWMGNGSWKGASCSAQTDAEADGGTRSSRWSCPGSTGSVKLNVELTPAGSVSIQAQMNGMRCLPMHGKCCEQSDPVYQ